MKIEFAKSLSGHDAGQIYLIADSDEKFVYLANGTTKPKSAPKKKSRKHVQVIKNLPGEVTECLVPEVTDLTIKRAIRLYCRIKDMNHK